MSFPRLHRRSRTPMGEGTEFDPLESSRPSGTLEADSPQSGAWALSGSDPPVWIAEVPETNGHAELEQRPELQGAAIVPAPLPTAQTEAEPNYEPAVDLPLYVKVISRFKWLVLAGLICAVGLSFLSMVRVSFVDGKPVFAYRQDEEWISFARVFVTRPGFQWGSTTPEAQIKNSKDPNAEAERIDSQRLAEQRLTSLAIIYANLVDTDAVRHYMQQEGRIPGRVEAAPIPAIQGESEVLPIISIAGTSKTPELSRELTARATDALRRYIVDQQNEAKVPKEARVVMPLIKKAGDTKLMTPRSKTLPIVVFMTVMVTVFVLAFLLDGIRSRKRVLEGYNPR